MRTVYAVSGGVSKFTKARHDKTYPAIVKEAYDYAIADIGIEHPQFFELVDGTVAAYFSDHFARQLMAGIIAQDYLGMCPKPSHRVEGGGATGGICFQEGWKAIASGYIDICLCYGFELMSHVQTWKGNEFIALASDVSFDYPVGGFYSGYYAMMVTRHMAEFGTTVEQMAHVSVKNHINAYHNPYAQKRNRYTIQDVRNAPMVAWPLTRLDICVMSDGAACTILCSEDGLAKLEKAGATIPRPLVRVPAIGRGTDAMRMADRPHQSYEDFYRYNALPNEMDDNSRTYYRELWVTPASTPSAPVAWGPEKPTRTPASPTRWRKLISLSCTMPTPPARSKPTRTWACAGTERVENSLPVGRLSCPVWITAWTCRRSRFVQSTLRGGSSPAAILWEQPD
jgi:hypothetical protein